ncbi:EGF domain-containing protein [Haliangium ochraceum]|nr:EGF domain-containing protein [Haliangium ochraceum]
MLVLLRAERAVFLGYLSLIALLGACFAPDYPQGIPCSGRQTCPPGQTCGADNVCRAVPLPPSSPNVDAAPVGIDAAAPDSAPAPSCADCDANASCEADTLPLSCRCNAGYAGDGFSCVDIDECAVSPDACGVGVCVNQDGGYACDCPAGYRDDGVTCVDIDECLADQPGTSCSPDATCTNTPGGHVCTCNPGFFGDGTSCRRPSSCADLLALAPATVTGVHTIDPDADGAAAPFDVFCDMDLEGGGWTLLLVSSDDGVDTWTMEARARMTTDTTPIGNLAATTRDFKSPGYHVLPFSALLFVHQPSGITAAYGDVGDGSIDFGSFLDAIDYPVCDFALAGNGHELTGGTLTRQGPLCDTDLYFNLGDHELDNISICRNPAGSSNATAFGPVWSTGNNNGCPFDDPAGAALGPHDVCGGCSPDIGARETDARGFGGPLGLNSGVAGQAENYIQMYAR